MGTSTSSCLYVTASSRLISDSEAESLQPARPRHLELGQRSPRSHASPTPPPLHYLDRTPHKTVDIALKVLICWCAFLRACVYFSPDGTANPGGVAVGGRRAVLLG